MADEKPPDYTAQTAQGDRKSEPPTISLVACFQTRDSDYMKPPLEEQLLEPDGTSLDALVLAGRVCSCHSVCACVPVTTCVCHAVCTCNLVTTPATAVATTPAGGMTTITTTRTTRPGGGTTLTLPGGTVTRPGGTSTFGGGSRPSGGRGGGGGGGGYYAPCF